MPANDDAARPAETALRVKNPGDRKKEAAERERARADAEDQRGQQAGGSGRL